MNRFVEQVLEFHKAFGHPCTGYKFYLESLSTKEKEALIALRAALIEEEAREFKEAAAKASKVDMLDALADLLVVTIGAALAFGFNIEEAMERVYVSNMSKLGGDGKPIYRSDGKVLKGENFKPPVLDDLV